jgi:FKBP-type peptidyl-prolyl cis-trans isomerase SlyD
MEILEHTVVSIRYKMTNSKGEVLENTLEGEPINYIHGKGNILPALEAELNGLKKGDCKTILISKEKGYNETDDEFIVEVIIDEIRQATELELKEGLLQFTEPAIDCKGGCQC